MDKQAQDSIQITTYELESGFLHLERGALSLEEMADMYGPVIKSWDGEMSAKQFFSLPDFNDI